RGSRPPTSRRRRASHRRPGRAAAARLLRRWRCCSRLSASGPGVELFRRSERLGVALRERALLEPVLLAALELEAVRREQRGDAARDLEREAAGEREGEAGDVRVAAARRVDRGLRLRDGNVELLARL